MSDSAVITPDDPLWRRRWWMLGSGILCVLSLVVFAIDVPHHRNWALLAWGLLVGAVAAVTTSLIIGNLANRRELAADVRVRWKRRAVLYAGSWVLGCVIAGLMAALLDQPWIDVVATAYVVLVALVMLVLYQRLRNRFSSP